MNRKLQPTLNTLREAWDRRARENARHYVATGQRAWTDEEFFRSGESTVEHYILNDRENICQGRLPGSMRVLEIGCGAGRVTRALARHFGEVHAVDISGEMVRRAKEAVAAYPNAHVYQNNGMDLSVVPANDFDFAFSTIVFQHIPSRAVIESYFREVHRLLRPGALFKVQVQGVTARRHPLRRLISEILRRTFPSRRRRRHAELTWHGREISRSDARHLADENGFELRHESGWDRQDYWLWLFKK